jgi:putative membrane protein
MNPIPFRDNRLLQGLLVWLGIFWIVTALGPLDRRDWFLENLLVFTYAAVLILSYWKFTFSNLSYGLFTVFLSLHLIGAHYTYSEVPFGYWLQQALDLSRNHYDRIVHFAYGLLIAYPFREILLRAARVSMHWSYFLSVTAVLAFSAFFEILEAIVAIIVSPELGAKYLGTQGDEWDAQEDMLLAFLGAILAMLVTWLLHKKSERTT